MWRDPTRPASSYDVRSAAGVGAAAAAAAAAAGAIAAAAASGVASSSPLLVPSATAAPVTTPCLPCHDDVGPMAYGASSGYAAALRRLARQAETAAGAGRALQAVRGRSSGVDDHRRLGTSSVRQDVAGSAGSDATVTTLHEGEAGKGVVAAVVGSVGDRRSNEDCRDNDGTSLFSYQAAAATPLQYAAYLRPLLLSSSTTEASNLGASLVDEAATNFSTSSSSSSASFPSFVGCWPNVAASEAVAAAQLCLLRLMTYREALHPQQVQQQQLLLQHLLAHTLLSSSGAGVLASTSAEIVAPTPIGAARSVATTAPQQQQQLPPCIVGSSAAKSSADGTSEPTGTSAASNVTRNHHILKHERNSPGDEDRVGFRPYAALNRCNGLARNGPPPSRDRDDATAPASSRIGRISPRTVPTSDVSSHSKNVTSAQSDTATHLDAARKHHLRKRVNVCSIRHRQTHSAATATADTLIGQRDAFPRPMAALPRSTLSADGSCNGVRLENYSGVRECLLAPEVAVQQSEKPDGHLRSFSTLDLAEVRRQSKLIQGVENSASDDDENDEGGEAKVHELTQRRLVIRTPMVAQSTGGQREPAEKKRLLAALGLATVHDATEMKCTMINRRRLRLGMRSETDDLDARLQSLSPLLDRLHASSSLHASRSGAKAPRKTCPELEHMDKVEFLLKLGLRSSTNNRCCSSSDGCNNSSRCDRSSPNYSAHSAGDAGTVGGLVLDLSGVDVTQLNA